MFDIGFAELLIIGVVGLLVIGPERLPGAVRTASVWVNKFRRSFNEIRDEVRQELHNDEVMQELKKTGDKIREDLTSAGEQLNELVDDASTVDNPTVSLTPGDKTEDASATTDDKKPSA